jgi:hypothetical protein
MKHRVSTMDGKLLLQVLKLEERHRVSQTTFKSKRVLNHR